MKKKLDLQLTQNSAPSPIKTNRSSQSPTSRGFEKGQITFNKADFLFLSGREDELTFSPRIKDKKYSSAVQFYENKLRIKANKCTFEDLMKWKGEYQKIEMDQSIIQYLFPSLQGVQGDIDSEQFINSPELAKKVIQAYELILDYYGLKFKDEATGELIPQENYKERQDQTLLKPLSKSVHAYRIKRILNFLSKTGFLIYCHRFIEFMKVLIKGNQSLINKTQIGQSERIDLKNVPIPKLAHLNDVYESDWRKYDEHDLNNEMQQKMLKNQSIFFKPSKYTKSKLLQQYEEGDKKQQIIRQQNDSA